MNSEVTNNPSDSESEFRVSSAEYGDPQSFWLAISRRQREVDKELDIKPATSEEIEAAKELAHKYLYPELALRTEEETLAILKQVYTSLYNLDKRLAAAMELINMDDLRTYGSLVTTKHRVIPADGGLSYEQEVGSPLSGHFDFEQVSPHAMGPYGPPDIAKTVNDSIERAKDYVRRIIVHSRAHDSGQYT